jgi:hypothetical protein
MVCNQIPLLAYKQERSPSGFELACECLAAPCRRKTDNLRRCFELIACLPAEVVPTMFFLLIILGSTDKRAPQGLASIAIRLELILIHLISQSRAQYGACMFVRRDAAQYNSVEIGLKFRND